jgi:hypothetical protein
MGKSQQGIYGAFNGRVGNVIGSTWKGTQVLRIRPASVANPQTDAQMETRKRFAMLGRFLSTQREAVNIGFSAQSVGMSPVNAALSENFRQAFTGAYPDLLIDFSQVKLSKGELLFPQNFVAAAAPGALINLSWLGTGENFGSTDQDSLIVGVFDPTNERGMVFNAFFRRNEATGVLALPDYWVGRTFEVMAFFKSSKNPSDIKPGYNVSDTVYGGSVTLVA